MTIAVAAAVIAAVVPAWNEKGAIGPTVSRLPRDVVGHVVVVDGGSRDGTVEEAEAAGAEVLHEHRRGYGRACLSGAERARALGAEIVLFLDGDGSDAGELAGRIAGPVADGSVDLVLALRGRTGREPGSMGIHQVLAGHLIGGAVGLMTGTRYRDMCAFRAIRIDALERLGMREMTYGWNLEMQIRAAAADMRVREVPMPYRCRISGQSKVAGTLPGTLRAGSRILRTLAVTGLDVRRQRRADGSRAGLSDHGEDRRQI